MTFARFFTFAGFFTFAQKTRKDQAGLREAGRRSREYSGQGGKVVCTLPSVPSYHTTLGTPSLHQPRVHTPAGSSDNSDITLTRAVAEVTVTGAGVTVVQEAGKPE